MIDQTQIIKLRDWYAARTHRERVIVLLLGWACIYLCWWLLFDRSLGVDRLELKTQLAQVQMQIDALSGASEDMQLKNSQNKTLSTQSNEVRQKKILGAHSQSVSFSLQDDSVLLSELFKPEPQMTVLSLKNDASAASNAGHSLVLELNSRYFVTLAYLQRIENLPWCLSWDSLEYRVTTYPEANVVIRFHAVNT